MQPKWEQVDQFLWRTPLSCGWLYRDIRNSEAYYEPDPERERKNFRERLGDDRTPFECSLTMRANMFQIVDIADSLMGSAMAN